MHAPLPSIGRTLTALLLALAAPAAGGRGTLEMLDQLEHGRWELRPRDPAAASESICLASGRQFIQLRHPVGGCSRLVVQDGLDEVTVQYICRGRGYGRTHIRRETNRLAQIDSQGIVDGLPFDFTVEARRTGECSG